jgi:hypothetical protein
VVSGVHRTDGCVLRGVGGLGDKCVECRHMVYATRAAMIDILTFRSYMVMFLRHV